MCLFYCVQEKAQAEQLQLGKSAVSTFALILT